MAFVIPMGTVSSSIYVWEFPDIMKFLRFVAVCIWAAYQPSFYHETISNDRDDDKAGEDEDETRSNTIDEKKCRIHEQ